MRSVSGMHGERKVLSIPQVCKAAGVSRRTVYNWIKTRKVGCVRIPSGIRIYEDSIWGEVTEKTNFAPLRVNLRTKPAA